MLSTPHMRTRTQSLGGGLKVLLVIGLCVVSLLASASADTEQTGQAGPAENITQSAPLTKFSAAGISFFYPSNWAKKTPTHELTSNAHNDRSILKLYPAPGASIDFWRSKNPTAKAAYNSLLLDMDLAARLQQKGQTAPPATRERLSHLKHDYVQVPIAKVFKFGVGNTFTGYQVASYFDQRHSKVLMRHYQRTVVFGWPNRILLFRLICAKADTDRLNIAFSKVLASFAVEQSN